MDPMVAMPVESKIGFQTCPPLVVFQMPPPGGSEVIDVGLIRDASDRRDTPTAKWPDQPPVKCLGREERGEQEQAGDSERLGRRRHEPQNTLS